MIHHRFSCPPRCIRRPTGWAATALLSLLYAGLTPADSVAQTSAFKTRVRFDNPTNHRRIEWGLVTVPFPEGVWTPGKSFHAPGYPSEITPFGAPYPDGTWRFGQLAVNLDLFPFETRFLEVREGRSSVPAFSHSPWVAEGLRNFGFEVEIGLAGGNSVTVDMNPTFAPLQGRSRRILQETKRVPGTDLVVDLWITQFANTDFMPFELRVTSSNPNSHAWHQSFEYIDMISTGAFATLRGENRRGAQAFARSINGPNRIRLMQADRFFDGQGQEWWGELIFFHPGVGAGSIPAPLRANTLVARLYFPLFGMSTDWRSSGAFGPFGYVPPNPPWINDGGEAATRAQRTRFENYRAGRGGPWDDWALGMLPRPAAPGDQQDFGAAKLLQIIASGIPLGIEEARLSASEEALRPVHHREFDGSLVTASNHPNWVTWDGRTHFNSGVSPDRLGKPYPAPSVTSSNANGWFGRDSEHWSSLVLASTYLLTGSPSLRYELENEAQLYIAGHTLPSQKPGWSTNGLAASRAIGRTLLSMSWNYVLTDNTQLRNQMAARVREVMSNRAMTNRVTGPVRPISVRAPDSRVLNVTHWRPWEESLAILGLEACYQATGEMAAHQLAYRAAESLMLYGWLIDPNKSWIGTAVGWKNNGEPLTAQEYASPTWVLWSYGTGFNEWALSAVKLARRYAVTYNNSKLLARADFLYQQLNSLRFKPRYSIGWDRFSEWEAVQ